MNRAKRLSVTAGSAPHAGGKFHLIAVVQAPDANQKLTLTLPEGMKLDASTPRTQSVPRGDYGQVNWLVEVSPRLLGETQASVRLEPDGVESRTKLTVGPRNSRLQLIADKPLPGKKGFWVAGYVQEPKAGQSLELKLEGPDGVTLRADHPARQNVPATPEPGQASRVLWWVEVGPRSEGQVTLTATLDPGGEHEQAVVNVKGGSVID